MLQRFRSKPSPTTVIACLALFFAVAGGSAIALQGKNSVDSGDIKKNAVKTADIAAKNVKNADIAANAVNSAKIKNATVGSGDLAANSVGTSQLQDGGVAAIDLAGDELYRKVGASGQPTFKNGVDDDCRWGNIADLPGGFGNRASFYKDKNGVVHLAGLINAADGPGGDALCDFDADGSDFQIFQLPTGYAPSGLEIQDGSFSSLAAGNQVIIAPVGGITLGSVQPEGMVLVNTADAQIISLDGITFRAGPGNGLPRKSAAVPGAGSAAGDTLLPDLGG